MKEPLRTFHYLAAFEKRGFLANMTDEQRWLLLDRIIEQGSHQNSWNAILELFASWEESSEKKLALNRTKDLLSGWDVHICQVNSSWQYLFDDDKLAPLAIMVKSIVISGRKNYGNWELKRVVESANARNLEHLRVHNSEIYEDGIQAIAKSTFLKVLSELSFENLTLDQQMIELLSSASNLKSLISLKLKDVGMRLEKVRVLSDSAIIKSLKSLDLSHNSLDDECLALLAISKGMGMLQTLNISHNYVRNSGVLNLLNSQRLQNLNQLNVSHNQLTEDFIAQIKDKEQKVKLIM